MTKVVFTYKTGRERLMMSREAELLRRLGRGSYATRDMRDPLAFPGTGDKRTCSEVDAYIKEQNASVIVDASRGVESSTLEVPAVAPVAKKRKYVRKAKAKE